MSQILTFQFFADSCDADQIRCAAYDYAQTNGASGVCLVLVTVNGSSNTVQVVANLNAKEASVVLPLFDWRKECSFGTAFGLQNSVFVVSDRPDETAMQSMRTVFEDIQRLFIFTLNRVDASITGFLLDRVHGSWAPVVRSAEGAAAAAIVLHSDLNSGTVESTINQPGGILEIGLRKENGQVLGLSAGGPVEVKV